MPARALWKGRLIVGKLEAAVNLFTAVQERKVHFDLGAAGISKAALTGGFFVSCRLNS